MPWDYKSQRLLLPFRSLRGAGGDGSCVSRPADCIAASPWLWDSARALLCLEKVRARGRDPLLFKDLILSGRMRT